MAVHLEEEEVVVDQEIEIGLGVVEVVGVIERLLLHLDILLEHIILPLL